MRFSVPAFIVPALIALLSFGSNALAAECYSRSGGYPCATLDEAMNAFSYYCANYYDKPCHEFVKITYKGTVWVGHVGAFNNPSDCFEAGRQIVYECYGKKDGGSWTSNQKSINVNYCQW
ncbi:uncharacterized protein BDCG_04461 [Blastomyces dermatitidis ER-3]|uniref:Secreted protein n=2 Tax=Ajellomyces dermatitidis TaxID=5039 RepID=F2TSR4_AJEDA|nr:uncharacterized protein BDCG_04461 [Blastomyces dermatitidis ER-3]EEQ89341.1 hypothetical protein BDCG_04461 [Blastomyces dermatitidis ER-3]EGE86277.1 hypothetical protein BDDG_09222 [Blastomyces dermatitidis ATCC 18188]